MTVGASARVQPHLPAAAQCARAKGTYAPHAPVAGEHRRSQSLARFLESISACIHITDTSCASSCNAPSTPTSCSPPRQPCPSRCAASFLATSSSQSCVQSHRKTVHPGSPTALFRPAAAGIVPQRALAAAIRPVSMQRPLVPAPARPLMSNAGILKIDPKKKR